LAFIGPWEIALVLAIVLILFGGKKLPELARSIGDSIRQYKKAVEGTESEKSGKEAILETAEKLGIDTRGKSIEEIAKEIAQKVEEKRNKNKQ
jgi:sec-independent protein translocase protein TatA